MKKIMERIFPCQIRVIENIFIPLSDGTRLSARIWLPEGAKNNPVPAILEYVPYRKNDATATLDALSHPYFASRGYASIRVDMRGSGDSDGILMDEYLKLEQDDALEILSWIGKQSYCTGSVGIFGYSWGGYAGLQVAALRPPELKGIISAYATNDRYETDVHYIGGSLFASDMIWWATTMQAFQARPPDPKNVGKRWRKMWLERLEKTPPMIEEWLRHQRRDSYWKHGSVCEDYSSITCPVFIIGGWADCYPGAALSLLEHLQVPCKCLIGPWGHAYPHIASPGPRIGFLQECVRWWDHCLKGIDTGIMNEPSLRAWMQDSVLPKTNYLDRPGHWISESVYPSNNIKVQRFYLGNNTLNKKATQEERFDIRGSFLAGSDAGVFCPAPESNNVSGGQFPPDQRTEDGLSLSFTSPTLPKTIEILGHTTATINFAVDCPEALMAIRLCDVTPDGSSTLVTRNIINLTHHKSHESPIHLIPGKRYTIKISLKATAYTFPAGHRIRVSISPTYWPWVWPSPKMVRLSIYTGPECHLDLPVRLPRYEDGQINPFESPITSQPISIEVLRNETHKRIKRQEMDTGLIELTWVDDSGRFRLVDSGFEYGESHIDTQQIIEGDPLSASIRTSRTITLGRGDWQTRVEVEGMLSSDADFFRVSSHINAYEKNTRVFSKSWDTSIPRDLT